MSEEGSPSPLTAAITAHKRALEAYMAATLFTAEVRRHCCEALEAVGKVSCIDENERVSRQQYLEAMSDIEGIVFKAFMAAREQQSG
jgi:hypothetical protein